MGRILLLAIFIFSGQVYAQVSVDTLKLDPVTISATRIGQRIIYQPVSITKIGKDQIVSAHGQDIGSLLQQFSTLYIRDNGPGGVSVISQRGLSGDQTRVIWEGLPLNHQMLGVTDLSLIQSNMISGISVSGGSGSSRFGSGSSGNVVLNTDINEELVSAGQTVGSAGNMITHGRAGFRTGRIKLSAAVSVQENENDYRYFSQRTGAEERRERGAFSNDQIMLSGIYNRKDWYVKSSFWYTASDHEIAENIFAGPGVAEQLDSSVRLANTFVKVNGDQRTEINVQAAKTTLDYFNPQLSINSLSESREVRSRVNHSYDINERINITASATAGYTAVETNNYDQIRNRTYLSGGAEATLNPVEPLSIYPSIRIDHYSDFGSALSPGLGLNYQLIENMLAVRGSVNRNFRAPTFNDLYWPNGGNENISSEYSLSYEIGVVQKSQSKWVLQNQLSVFLIDLNDGIRWLPDSGGNFLAQNIQSIRSEGVEMENKAERRISTVGLTINSVLSYTRSYFSEQRFSGDQAVGNQLPYVPEWQWKGGLRIDKDQFSLFFNSRYTSLRFTTEQASLQNAVDAFFVSDAGLSFTVPVNDLMLNFGFTVNNLFDQQYSVVRYYPMPLRNFIFNLTLSRKL